MKRQLFIFFIVFISLPKLIKLLHDLKILRISAIDGVNSKWMKTCTKKTKEEKFGIQEQCDCISTLNYDPNGEENYIARNKLEYSHLNSRGTEDRQRVAVHQIAEKIFTESYDSEAQKMISYSQ